MKIISVGKARQLLLEISLAVVCVGCYAFVAWPALFAEHLAGWDTPGHQYLFEVFLKFLKSGRVSGYDPLWFAGYPAFTFYGFLAYLYLGLPHFLTLGLIKPEASFALSVFLLPIFLLLCQYILVRSWFGRKYAAWAVLVTFFFLAAPYNIAPVGVGAASLYRMGLIPNFFSLCLLSLLLASFAPLKDKPSLKTTAISGLLLAAIIVSHPVTTLLTVVLMGVFVATQAAGSLLKTERFWPASVAVVLAGVLALVCTSWWWTEFISNLWLTSGRKSGLEYGDPINVLFYNINLSYFYKTIRYRDWWLLIPLPSFVLAAAGIVGITQAFRKGSAFLPVSFLTCLIFLPRNIFSEISSLSIHYYRFSAGLFILFLPLTALGLGEISRKAMQIRQERLRWLSLSILVVLGGYSVFVSSTWLSEAHSDRYSFATKDYPGSDWAVEIGEKLAAVWKDGRVGIEESPSMLYWLGSAQYFRSMLSLLHKIPVVPGLLAESSVSSAFLVEPLAVKSKSLVWARAPFGMSGRSKDFGELEGALLRLGLYNTRYILATSHSYTNALEELSPELVQDVAQARNFHLFELTQYRPFLESTSYKPFLFVDKGGLDFRRFSERWYEDSRLFDYPVLYTKMPHHELPEEERRLIGGLIASYPFGSFIARADYEKLAALDVPIIILGPFPSIDSPETDKIRFIPRFASSTLGRGLNELLMELQYFAPQKSVRTPIIPVVKEASRVKFRHRGGVIINYSYYPRWKSMDRSQTVFFVTPSLMFVFAKGDTELVYR